VAYATAFGEIVAPSLRRFGPELILVSAGFDAHWADPLAEMRVSTSGFVAMTETLVGLAEELSGGRIAFCLEGGYDLEALATTVRSVVAVLADDTPVDVLGPPPGGALTTIDPIVERIQRLHGL
jgi:acetoin utilization deacetylase AcuC-like enzyme